MPVIILLPLLVAEYSYYQGVKLALTSSVKLWIIHEEKLADLCQVCSYVSSFPLSKDESQRDHLKKGKICALMSINLQFRDILPSLQEVLFFQ